MNKSLSAFFVALLLVACNSKKQPTPFACGTKNDTTECFAGNNARGKVLFKAKCSSCHTSTDQVSTGPGLKGVMDRIPSLEWAHDFIHDNNKLRASGDAYSNAIYAQYNHAVMTCFPELSNNDIDSILEYLNGNPIHSLFDSTP